MYHINSSKYWHRKGNGHGPNTQIVHSFGLKHSLSIFSCRKSRDTCLHSFKLLFWKERLACYHFCMCLQPKQWVHSAGFCASLQLFLNDNAAHVFECVLRVHVRGAVARSLNVSAEEKFSAHTAERRMGWRHTNAELIPGHQTGYVHFYCYKIR